MSPKRDREVAFQPQRTADRSFDELAKGLASGNMSRRRALRLMGAAFVSTVMASIPAVVSAAPPAHSRACGAKKTRCPGSKKCVDLSSDRNSCGACGNVCESPEDLCCDGVCTNVVFNRNDCGACGNVCAEGEDCCGERCVPLNTRENCGCCGCGCLEVEICVNGSCQCPEPGQTVCANVCCPEGHCVFDEATQSFTCVA
jgi:hypothetical protein